MQSSNIGKLCTQKAHVAKESRELKLIQKGDEGGQLTLDDLGFRKLDDVGVSRVCIGKLSDDFQWVINIREVQTLRVEVLDVMDAIEVLVSFEESLYCRQYLMRKRVN